MTAVVTPQSLVDHAVAASTADDCIAIVRDTTSANLRWANNTLTTNGVMHAVSVTVISFIRRADGVATGSVTGSATTPGAGRPTSCGRPTPPPGPAPPPRTPTSWSATASRLTGTTRRSPPTSTCTTRSRPPSARRSGAPSDGGRVLYGFVNHESTTTYLGSTTGLRLRHVQPTGHYGCTGKTADLSQSAWVGGATRDFADVDALGAGGDARAAAGLGRPPGRPARRALRHDPAAHRGRRPDDRRLLVRRRPGRPRGPVGLRRARRRHPDRRADHQAGREPLLRPAPPRPRVRAVRDGHARPATTSSVFDNGLPLRAHRLAPRRRARRAAADPAHRGDDRAAGHPDDRQPGAERRRRPRDASTTSSPAPSAACC